MVKKMGNTTKALLKTYILYVLVYKFLSKKKQKKNHFKFYSEKQQLAAASTSKQREEVKEENYFSTSTQEHKTARMLTLPPVFALYNYTIKFPETIFSVVKTSAHCISILN